jgi:hypothetical protein
MITYGTAIDKWVGSFSDQTAFYLVIIDSESQMSFCNSSFYSSFQSASASAAPPAGSVHTSASAGRESFSSLVHECDRPQLSSALSTCALRDQAIHTELRLKRGHFRWIDWEISRIQKPDNMSDKFLCLGTEIAAEDQHKKNLQSFEQHYQKDNGLFLSFMEHTPWFTWIVDEEENLMFANKSFLEYFHLDESAFGKELNCILPGSIVGLLAETHHKVLRNDMTANSIAKWPMTDGREQACRITAFPVRAAPSARMIGGSAIPV